MVKGATENERALTWPFSRGETESPPGNARFTLEGGGWLSPTVRSYADARKHEQK